MIFPCKFGNEDAVNPLAGKAVDKQGEAGSLEQRADCKDFPSESRGLSIRARSITFGQPPSLIGRFQEGRR